MPLEVKKVGTHIFLFGELWEVLSAMEEHEDNRIRILARELRRHLSEKDTDFHNAEVVGIVDKIGSLWKLAWAHSKFGISSRELPMIIVIINQGCHGGWFMVRWTKKQKFVLTEVSY